MEKEMGENARIKNDIRKVEEYGGSLTLYKPYHKQSVSLHKSQRE